MSVVGIRRLILHCLKAGRLLLAGLVFALPVFTSTTFASTAFAGQSPLIFGVFPNLSPKVLVETYRPLADFLQDRLQRRIEIYSAPDFRTFAANTARGDYDLLLTAPHLAWLARQDAGYRPLLKYAEPVHGVLVVRADSPIQTTAQLRGKLIAIADPLAVVVMAMQAQLRAQGLAPGSSIQMENAQSHNNAAMRVFSGGVEAAILGAQPYRRLPAEVQSGLRILAETPSLSSQMFLTHPRLREQEALAVRQMLLVYAATSEGRAFMERGGFGGFAELDGRELLAFKTYALEVQAQLKAPR